MAVEINIPKPIIDLPETLTNGNETDGNDIVLTPLDRVVVGANRAGLSKGTFDTSRGGDKGVSLICANDLELNWQSGFLRNIVPDGDGTPLPLNLDSEIVYTELVPTTPTYGTSLVTKDYADTKVEKIEGKGLSENDFTNTLKSKLDGIEDGAQVNVNADWNATSGDAEILNKPTIPSAVTNTSDLINDGADGVNPFITALDIPTAGQAGTLVREVKNMTGATLTKGTVVYISGANGNKALVSKARANAESTSARTFGLIQSNILNNGVGYCVVIGDISGLDTSAFTEGAQLYLSGTVAGEYTSTKTLAPTHLVYVGKVTRSHPTQGQIEVQIQNGYELDEIHDVAISSVSDKQLLSYDSSTSLWKNKSVTTADIADSTNKRYQTDNQQSFNDATSSIQTQLDGKQSKLLVKKLGASSTIATTVESIIGNVEILGGTLASTDYLNIKSRVRKTGSNGTYLLRYYLNTTSNTLTGATQIAISATQTATSLISANFERDFTIDGGNLYGYPFATANNDGIVSATAVGSVAYTVATTYYIITTITLASALDTASLIGQKITNF